MTIRRIDLFGAIVLFAAGCAASAARQAPDPVKGYILCEDLNCVDALTSLKACGSRCVPSLLDVLQSALAKADDPRPTEFARTRAADALGELGDRRALQPSQQTLRDSRPRCERHPLVRSAS
jgi:HEAT repeat protein